METETPAAALEREHREIDKAVAAFLRDPAEEQHRSGLKSAMHELRHHIYLEEEFLFPLLSTMEEALTAPVFVMLREHAQIWATLEALERALDADDGDGAVSGLCRELTIQLLHHNVKEERVLYPRADIDLNDAALEKLRALLDSTDLPEGWVCIKAR
jgi:regulator of cell morphogenesis and NO signaling